MENSNLKVNSKRGIVLLVILATFVSLVISVATVGLGLNRAYAANVVDVVPSIDANGVISITLPENIADINHTYGFFELRIKKGHESNAFLFGNYNDGDYGVWRAVSGEEDFDFWLNSYATYNSSTKTVTFDTVGYLNSKRFYETGEYSFCFARQLLSNTGSPEQFNYSSPVFFDYVQTVSLPLDPVKTGYNFVGWYYDTALTDPFVPGNKLTADISLYAKFEEISYTYTIYGYLDKKLETASVRFSETKILSDFVAPAIIGFEFVGFFSDSAMSVAYDMSTPIKSNTNIYLKYKIIDSYNVNFYVDGTLYKTLKVPYNSILGEFPAVVNTLKSIAPVCSDAEMKTPVDPLKMSINKDTDFFSKAVIGDTIDKPIETPKIDEIVDTVTNSTKAFFNKYKIYFIVAGSVSAFALVLGVAIKIFSKKKRVK